MSESFVDLTYRGLALGRRIKLTAVRPTTGYLELPMPMPVGTSISIGTDDGVVFDATVTQIHEQVGGSDRVPGMTVAPVLAAEAAQAWWQARVTAPQESETKPERGKPITVRPRSHTIPAPPPAEAPADDPKRTMVMNAVDQEMLAKLTQSEGEVEHLVRRTGEHAVVDDGLRTTVMDAVDPAALGLDVGASGSMAAASGDEAAGDDDGGDDGNGGGEPKPAAKPAGGGKKRKKKR